MEALGGGQPRYPLAVGVRRSRVEDAEEDSLYVGGIFWRRARRLEL